jgi:hypothetical protein
MIMRDCVCRDLGIWKRPLVRAYFERVLQKTDWWCTAVRYRQGYYFEDSMCFAGRETDEAPLTKAVVLTPAVRGRTMSRTPRTSTTRREWRQQPVERPADEEPDDDEPDESISQASDTTAPIDPGASASTGPTTGVQDSAMVGSASSGAAQQRTGSLVPQPSACKDYRLKLTAEQRAKAAKRAKTPAVFIKTSVGGETH